MPSFYPRSMPRGQLPLTPPEYAPPYTGNNYAGMQYHQPYSQSGPPTVLKSSEPVYEYADRRGAAASYNTTLPSMMYPPAASVYPHPPTTAAQTTQYYASKMAPILPPLLPMRPPTYEQTMAGDLPFQQVRDEVQAQAKAEKPVGGVSATLDYDMETMTDFVTEMAHGIIQPGAQQSIEPTFRKWVHQVLCATRLPSATILLSLQYLSMRMTQLSNGDQRRNHQNQRQRMLTVALILGSKFLDDNTFINRSWAEVSGIEISVLNWMELEWFQAMDHHLHRDPKERQGFDSWQRHWKDYERQVNVRRNGNVKLTPLDTSVPYHKTSLPAWSPPARYPSQRKRFSGLPQTQAEPMQLDTPAFTPYDSAWLLSRSASTSSPVTAVHSGSTTPEFYASSGSNTPWSAHEGYSRRTMFGFPPSHSAVPHVPHVSQPQAQQASQYSYYNSTVLPPPGMPYVQGHSFGCSCFFCSKNPAHCFMGHQSYGQAMPVAG